MACRAEIEAVVSISETLFRVVDDDDEDDDDDDDDVQQRFLGPDSFVS